MQGNLLTAALLLGAWALAIRQLSLEWNINPEYQYGWIVPLLTGLLAWRAWGTRPPPGPRLFSPLASIFAVLLIAALAFPLRVIEQANPDWRLLNDYFGLQAILLTALVLNESGGRPWLRHFAFPLLFPLVAIPWPSGIESDIIEGLQRFVAAFGVEGASWMGWSARQSGNLIVLSQGIVGINEACSGIRSLQSSLMVSLFLGAYFQLPTARRWLLVILSLAFAFALNVARAFLLISLMALHGSETLLKFHDPAGFTIALLTLLLLWFSANLLTVPVKAAPLSARVRQPGLRVSFRLGLILLAAWIGAELFGQGWYLWRESSFVPAQVWTLRWPPPRPGFHNTEIDEFARSLLRYNESRHGSWTDRFHWEIFYFTWKPGGSSAGLAGLHHPDICLPAVGFIMKQNLGIEPMAINGIVLPVSRSLFQYPSSGRLLYVYQVLTDDRVLKTEAGQPVSSAGTGMRQRLEAAWSGRRNPGQRSVLITIQGPVSQEQADEAVQTLLKDSVTLEGKA